MAVDYCIRSGAVMSICIMHRLNKRVAVPYDVVEHGNRSYARPAKQLLTAEFSTLSTYIYRAPTPSNTLELTRPPPPTHFHPVVFFFHSFEPISTFQGSLLFLVRVNTRVIMLNDGSLEIFNIFQYEFSEWKLNSLKSTKSLQQ